MTGVDQPLSMDRVAHATDHAAEKLAQGDVAGKVMQASKRHISIFMPCYNEADNIEAACDAVRKVMAALEFSYEHVFIDNASTDATVELLRKQCALDPRIKVIVNSRNFGQVRSPFHGLIQCSGEAVIVLPSDLQEPPSLIPALLEKWRQGYRSVLLVKSSTRDPLVLGLVRKVYYKIVKKLCDIELVEGATGFGLYDHSVIEVLRTIPDPYPYFRGLVCDVGAPVGRLHYDQLARAGGRTKNSFFSLLDVALLGFTTHSKAPLRVATMAGFIMSGLSLATSVGYLIAKLLFWYNFAFGLAPMLIGLFFIGSVQLFFIGLLGEYVGAVNTHMQQRPRVVERERINFDQESS